MIGSGNRQLVLAGLPYTGKTSFLALFYLALMNGSTQKLQLGSYQDDREYLNEIADRLMRCEEAIHTQVEEHRELSLSIELSTPNATATLRIPDLSGETWEEAVLRRYWSREVDEQVRASEAILIFIHPERIDMGPSIDAVDEALAALSGESQHTQQATSQEANQGTLELKGDPPTQVLLVDLLQLTVEQRGLRPARACVIVSAWDKVSEKLSPDTFISRNLPLLDQYISANRKWLSARTYGVSAQGGDFTKSANKLAKRDPVERAKVIAGGGEKIAIEDPIAWALGLDP